MIVSHYTKVTLFIITLVTHLLSIGSTAIITNQEFLKLKNTVQYRLRDAVQKHNYLFVERSINELDLFTTQNSNSELLISAEKLKVQCYDVLAQYKKKHDSLYRYANWLAKGDPDKAAGVLLAEADTLYEDDEPSESLLLYEMIARQFPSSNVAPIALYRAAQINELDQVRLHLFVEETPLADRESFQKYLLLLQQYPSSNEAEVAVIKLFEIGLRIDKLDQAFELLTSFIKHNSSNPKFETIFLNLNRLLSKPETLDQRNRLRKIYLDNYPNGSSVDLFKSLPNQMPHK
jgi:outer membrane protein assembly factor BamD (BamD/ComL family)